VSKRSGPGTRDIFVMIVNRRSVMVLFASAARRLVFLESPLHRNWFQIRDISAIRPDPLGESATIRDAHRTDRTSPKIRSS
jgi:hypothetical protein